MNITIKDVAKIASVSYFLVSRALSGSNQVSESTRKRIIEMGFLAADYLIKLGHKRIGFVGGRRIG